MNKQVIIISGPTACGKTQTSLNIANFLKKTTQKKIEIINFDSLLFYSELNIGTAKPTPDELSLFPHHMINVISIREEFNAARFIAETKKILEQMSDEQIFILVGGSGFYLRSLLKGMYEGPSSSDKIKEEVQKNYQQNGIAYILSFLQEHDPESIRTLHPNDHYRLLRAYEFFLTTGMPISIQKTKMEDQNPYDFSKNIFPDHFFTHFYLDLPKEKHWEIIQNRTEQMIKNGLVEEVRSLLLSNFTGQEKALQSIGHKETLQFLRGELKNIDELKEKISIATRQLAKSQRTFFNKVQPKIQINPLEDQAKLLSLLNAFSAY